MGFVTGLAQRVRGHSIPITERQTPGRRTGSVGSVPPTPELRSGHCLFDAEGATRASWFKLFGLLPALLGVLPWLCFSPFALADGYVSKQSRVHYVANRFCQTGQSYRAAAEADLAWYDAHAGTCGDGSRPGYFLVLARIQENTPQQYACTGLTIPGAAAHHYEIWAYPCPGWIGGPTVLDYTNVLALDSPTCPEHSTEQPDQRCRCDVGYAPSPVEANKCIRLAVLDQTIQPQRCDRPIGNPIYPLRGIKRESIDTGMRIGPHVWRITYDSSPRGPQAVPDLDVLDIEPPALVPLWTSSLHRQLFVGEGGRVARVTRGDGTAVGFHGSAAGFSGGPDVDDRLVADGSGHRFLDAREQAWESYDAAGKLVSITWHHGARLTFHYSDVATPATVAPAPGFLVAVHDDFGRGLSLEYESDTSLQRTPQGRLKRVIDPVGGSIGIVYSGGLPSALIWQDDGSRQFRYESGTHPWALTGVIAETGVRVATFGYDAAGRAVSTERGGGVERFTVDYATAPEIVVEESYDAAADQVVRVRRWRGPSGTAVATPTGSTNALAGVDLHGSPRLSGQSQPAGSGCAASTSARTYDANGNLASQDDFNGVRSCFANDTARNLETARVEGLSTTAACGSVVVAGATLPQGSRKISTEWHPDWRMPARKAEPGRITTWVYNGRPDPFDNNALATCAPADAILPDGKPIAVLCRRVDQTTTDIDGSHAFAAAPDTQVPARAQSWTYNRFGQVLLHDGPRSDVADITAYTYYGATTPEYVAGDQRSATTPLGHTTWFTRYNRNGQLLESVDPNGVVTTHTYDLRHRLTSSNVGGELTSYTYDEAGLLRRVTQGDGSYVSYAYDTAQRLVGVQDGLGNRIQYTLDGAGNRLTEQSFDPAGALRSQLQRVFDALGRVQQTIGSE